MDLMKKVFLGFSLLVLFVALITSIAYVLAKPEKARGPSEKATGNFSFEAGTLLSSVNFNAQEQESDWTYSGDNWNIVGDWVLTTVFGGADYVHDMTITSQVEGVLAGTGSYPSGGPPVATWTLTGTISGRDVSLKIQYDGISYNETLTGSIGANGVLSGTYINSGGSGGTWSASGDAVLAPDGYTGKGQLRYSDSGDDWYDVSIDQVNVKYDMAYLAGPVTNASDPDLVGSWLSAAVHDGDGLASGSDRVWLELTDMITAKFNVLNGIAPGLEHAVTDGNLKVHAN